MVDNPQTESRSLLDGFTAGEVLGEAETIDPAGAARIAFDPQIAPIAPTVALATENAKTTLGVFGGVGVLRCII